MKPHTFKDFALDQLRDLGPVECRPMFGGFGLYAGGIFFAIIFRDALYFKTGERTRADYERRGCRPFRPSGKQTLKSYYEVPAEILENAPELCAWARAAITAR